MNATYLFAIVALLASPSAAEQYTLEGRVLQYTPAEGEAIELELSTAGQALLVHEEKVYVACGPHGALVVDVSDPAALKELGRRELGGAVTGFFVLDGAIWARVRRLEARPLEAGIVAGKPNDVVSPATPFSSEEPSGTAPEAEVLERLAEGVVVGIGADEGVKRGGRMEIFLRHSVDVGGGEQATGEELVMVGKVTGVSPQRAIVKLGVNERVPTGAMARPSSKAITSSRTQPPRIDGIWEFELTARPFLALGRLGFGTISDATARRRFESPWAVEARLEPMSIGIADEGNIVALAGNLIGSYDNRLFSVGLGLGWAAINAAAGDSVGEKGERFGESEARSGLSIAQGARLGSRDGLHISVYNTFLYYHERFNYGGTSATLQLPVSEGLWFIARGGGGEPTGYGFGEIGLRVLLAGSGDRGSLYLSPSVGGGGLFKEQGCEDFEGCGGSIGYGGPLVGLGLEWRR
ncbi:MAG: hypothetical protein CME06_16825 [Gemmatimonadetes bacterium]|nr:hypothetical protein [Gemmatimonadota bacterium]